MSEVVKKNNITVGWLIYFIICNFLIIITSYYTSSGIPLCIASVTGASYVLLIAKEKRVAFIIGIINVLTYGAILIEQKVYGGAFYNIAYSLPMLIYGYIKWGKASKQENSGVKIISNKNRIILTICFTIAIIAYTLLLEKMNGTYPLLDSISTVSGFLGIYLMSNKYIEQWPVWIVSNFVNVILWTILTKQVYTNLPVAVMWAIYLINSIYGYITWRKYNKKIK